MESNESFSSMCVSSIVSTVGRPSLVTSCDKSSSVPRCVVHSAYSEDRLRLFCCSCRIADIVELTQWSQSPPIECCTRLVYYASRKDSYRQDCLFAEAISFPPLPETTDTNRRAGNCPCFRKWHCFLRLRTSRSCWKNPSNEGSKW